MPTTGSDLVVVLVAAVLILLIWAALFLILRQFVLWYFRINERTELLRDIRDSLRKAQATTTAWVPDSRLPAADVAVQRRRGESQDQFNSRVADEMQSRRTS